MCTKGDVRLSPKDSRRIASCLLVSNNDVLLGGFQIHAGTERLSTNVNKERPPQELLDEGSMVISIACLLGLSGREVLKFALGRVAAKCGLHRAVLGQNHEEWTLPGELAPDGLAHTLYLGGVWILK